MNNHFIRADGSLEALIWLVLALIWAAAQVIRRLATRPERLPPPRRFSPPPKPAPTPPSATDIEQAMREFLTQLSTQPTAQVPRPPPPPRARPPATPSVQVRTVAAQLRPVQKPTPPPTPEEAPAAYPQVEELAPAAAAPETLRQLTTSARAQALSVPTLKLPTTPFFSGARGAHRSPFRPSWRGRNALRRAMVSHIILGPPLGLRPRAGGLGDMPV